MVESAGEEDKEYVFFFACGMCQLESHKPYVTGRGNESIYTKITFRSAVNHQQLEM